VFCSNLSLYLKAKALLNSIAGQRSLSLNMCSSYGILYFFNAYSYSIELSGKSEVVFHKNAGGVVSLASL
jgi:hypothetical protein